MNYNKVNKFILSELINICGEKDVIVDKKRIIDYSHDEYIKPDENTFPELVVKPKTVYEISKIIKLANRNLIPVTVRGGGTGLSGGAVSFCGGILLSMENLKKIVEVDKKNFMATVESGVTLQEFAKELEKHNLFFPPKPGDEYAMIGGMIATNAGGARVVKYGTMRNLVRGLEVVLPDGEIINVGGKLIKNSAGYSLLNLFIGSEGTLGIITKAIISIMSRNVNTLTILVPYDNIDSAIKTVTEILNTKNVPVSIEFLELEPILLTEKLLGKSWPVKVGKAHLMIVIDNKCGECVNEQTEHISEICNNNGALEIFVAENNVKQKEIAEIRSNLYESIKNYVVEILDIAVPPASIGDFVNELHQLEKKYSVWLPTYGHAADGNVHTHYMSGKYFNGEIIPVPENEWRSKRDLVVEEIVKTGISFGGSISGEHGIGVTKINFMRSMYSEKYLDLLKKIKTVFDENNILNPGKMIPSL